MKLTTDRVLALSLPLTGLVQAQNTTQHGLQRKSYGDSVWDAAIAKAVDLVAQMTPEEMNNITFGNSATGGCSGLSNAVPRLGFPGLCLNDGPSGLRNILSNAYPAGVSVAASFNSSLAYERGYYMGAEFKRKGSDAILGPVVGPLGRVALGGRNWEGFGNDPYLAGQLVASSIEAMQKSVITVVKHYILNEQETERYSRNSPSVSSDVDDVTLHELYVAPFQDAVHAGSAGVMCSYNRINGTYACEDDRTLNQVLKDEVNFGGFVVSDWVFAQRSGLPSANGGLDMAMPNSPYWDNNKLAAAAKNGTFSMDRLRDMAHRVLSAWFLHNSPGSNDKPPGFGLAASLLNDRTVVDGRDPAADSVLRSAAIEGHVLVKNVNNALPLKAPRVLSIFGYDSSVPTLNNPSSGGVSRYDGFQAVNITDTEIFAGFTGSARNFTSIDIADLGTLVTAGGSGAGHPPYIIDPFSALTRRAREDRTFLFWDFESFTPDVAQSSDACLVFINQFDSEAFERTELSDTASDSLVKNVANKCDNTIVIIHNTWIRLVENWIEHPNVTAVIYAHLPGQESGDALVDILYGVVSPSGRLPYTVAKNESDYGSTLRPTPASNDTQSVFTEGTNIDYRHFLNEGITPRFPFGYGLTYSNFSYSNINARWLCGQRELQSYPPNLKTLIPGGVKSLFDALAVVTAQVSNTGNVAAAEVAQLYVRHPGEDKIHTLKGFSKLLIKQGGSKRAEFKVTRRDLSHWDTDAQQWELPRGQFTFFVGPDVEDLTLSTTLSV